MRIEKLLSAALLAAAAPSANATTIIYNDFSSTAGLSVNGDAASATSLGRPVLRLVPSALTKSGSAFSSSAITFGADYGFSTRFTFNINTLIGGGADGIVFVIQPNANNVGGSGGGIGYGGITHSLGVEYDDYNNGTIDLNSGNHIGIDTNGVLKSLVQADAPFALDGARDLTSWIDYNGVTKTLEVRLNNANVRPTTALLSYVIDVPAIVGSPNAFVGFTSGTGGSAANHDIVNWEFRDRFEPIGGAVPEPATWTMMIAGLGLAGAAARRRRAVRTGLALR